MMEGLANLGLPFVVETTYIVEHWHGTGIRLCRSSFLTHLLAYFLCFRYSVVVNILKLFWKHREDSL